MKFDREKIIEIANLAKLKLSDGEVKQLSKELSSISAFVEQLNDLKLDLNQEIEKKYLDLEDLGRIDEVLVVEAKEKNLSLNQKKRDSGLVIAPKIN